jgi:hypothetical protein
VARFRSRLSYSNVVATIAVFIALGGGAYAASSGGIGSGGKLVQCVGKGGKERAIPTGRSCKRGEKEVDVNEQGVPGAIGPQGNQGVQGKQGVQGIQGTPGATGMQGLKGDPGTPAVTFWAVFDGNGTVVRSSGLAGQDMKGTGVYHPFWNSGISTCSYSATLRNGAVAGATISADLGSFPDTVDVHTFNAAQTAADEPFSIQVFC